MRKVRNFSPPADFFGGALSSESASCDDSEEASVKGVGSVAKLSVFGSLSSGIEVGERVNQRLRDIIP